jgi:acyl phosphate:glycerol-3-phosphate acyltransferase
MSIIISVSIGYLLGSIPTAFIILKFRRGIDIRNEGSGNVGTLNSYEVTNSKKIGLVVLFIDSLKGFLSVVVIKIFFGDQFLLPMFSLLFAVLGHCYSAWLKFRGGRGLATAAGGALALAPLILILWGLFWLVIHKLRNDIHISNISATALIIFSAVFFSNSLNKLSFPPAESNFIFGFSLSLLMLIILSKHSEPIKFLLKNN